MSYKNTSGIQPVEVKVLIKPDPVEEKIGSIFRPDTVRAKEQMAQVKATLIAVGGNAFEDWSPPKPSVGDRVYVAKYAGIKDIEGADGEKYCMVNDVDICAIIEEEK